MKLPNTYEDIKKAQKIPLNMPLFYSFAQSEMYLPWPTQRIAAPKPLIAAAIRIMTWISVLLMSTLGY